MKIWWIKDYLSGEVIDQRFYSEKEEAVKRRNEIGYGVVVEWDTDNPLENSPIIKT